MHIEYWDFSLEIKDLERVMGIEPTYAAWEAAVLPLNYTRAMGYRSRDVIVECFKDGDNKDFTPGR